MPFNGSGGFDPISAPDFPAVSGELILASQFNNVLLDVFSGLGQVITRDGQSTATADLPMGGFKHKNASAATSGGQYLVYNQTGGKLSSSFQVNNSGTGQAYLEALHGANSFAFGWNATGAANEWGAPNNAGFIGSKPNTPFWLVVGAAPKVEVSGLGLFPAENGTLSFGSSTTKKWGNAHAVSFTGYKNGDFGSPPNAGLTTTNDGGGGAAVLSFIRTGTWGIGMGLDTDNVFKIGGYTDGAGFFRFTASKTAAAVSGTFTAAGLIYGNGGGLGLGKITATSGSPSGGSNGDMHLQY